MYRKSNEVKNLRMWSSIHIKRKKFEKSKAEKKVLSPIFEISPGESLTNPNSVCPCMEGSKFMNINYIFSLRKFPSKKSSPPKKCLNLSPTNWIKTSVKCL